MRNAGHDFKIRARVGRFSEVQEGEGAHSESLTDLETRVATPLQRTHPPMTKRIIHLGLCATVIVSLAAVANAASAARKTATVLAVQRALNSVANIHSEKTAKAKGELFSAQPGRKVNGMGTGIVIDERGYIITNHHVVDKVDSLRVTMHDGSSYDAQVVSYDRAHDLALIKVNPTRPLQVMPFGTSSDLMLGETVIAVGNAFGYENTVTIGIVSSLSRDVEVNEKQSYKNLIQTDASINPGNSGGPLVNLDGEAVGINVAIRAGAQRIGFAIPIDDARRVIAGLLSIEQLNQTTHGLSTTDIKTERVRKLRVKSARPGSPAEKSGLETGDVVVKAGTVDVVDGADFERAMLGRKAGDEIEIVVRRDGKNQTLNLKLSALAGATTKTVVRANNPDSPSERAWRLFGIKLQKLHQREVGLVSPRYRGGMRVVSVRPNSSAAQNGISVGDILVGLHIWETVNFDNLTYVMDHPQLKVFSPLKFYILRGDETLYGHLQVASKQK